MVFFCFIYCLFKYIPISLSPYVSYLVHQARLSRPELVVLPAPLDIYAPQRQ